VPSSIIRSAGAQAPPGARVFVTGGATRPVHQTEINDPTLAHPAQAAGPAQPGGAGLAGGPLSFDVA
jgi:hypothetical protein